MDASSWGAAVVNQTEGRLVSTDGTVFRGLTRSAKIGHLMLAAASKCAGEEARQMS